MNRFSLLRGSPAKVLGFLLLCLVAVLGFASVANASSASLPATITGRVTDAGGVTGLPNVQISIDGETSDTALWGFTQTAVTDSSGNFVVTDVIQGTYRMYVNAPNESAYATAYAEANPWHDEYASSSGIDNRARILGGTTRSAGTIKLRANGTVHGHGVDGGVAVPGSEIVAEITYDGISYRRWATTGADGSFTIPDALPGDWSLVYSGTRAGKVPGDAKPGGSWGTNGDPVTQSEPVVFSLAPDEDKNLGDLEFNQGQLVTGATSESYLTKSYSISAIGVTAVKDNLNPEEDDTYYWQVGDDGVASAYLPAGNWTMTYTDDSGCYANATLTPFSTTVGGPELIKNQTLTKKPGTYALHGHVSELGGAANAPAWITASKVDPSYAEPEFFRRVKSNSPSNSDYLIRLPAVTGFTGNKFKVQWADMADPPDEPFVHVTQEATITPTGSDIPLDKALPKGGTIKGTVRDEDGNPIPGVVVNAIKRDYFPVFGDFAWSGADNWWTRTKADGTYAIGGLPTNSDYKVNFSAYYDVGMPLPEKYKDYYRRTWKNRPNIDSLNQSATPVAVDHNPVSVTAPAVTPGIDETLTLGGYVALHADGPAHPTGAVWCDVMYQVPGTTKWVEIDSGYTTGGTFQKLWKVLPVGQYKVMYNDYFGRGSGTWEFDLAANERKYTSVLVPAPMTFGSGSGASGSSTGDTREPSSRAPAAVKVTSGLSRFKGSFVGLIGGGSGLKNGGAGGAMLTVKTGSVPSGAPRLPKYHVALPVSVLDVKSTGTPVVGKWTLTLAYNSSVPDGEVPWVRVVHYKTGGTTEILAPIARNLSNHTVQVQTSSLSPFRMAFRRHTVKLGKPVASSTWKRTKKYGVYGSLSPAHVPGKKTVTLKVYRRNSARRYVYYKSFSAPNSVSGKRYSGVLKLKAGKYRIRAMVGKGTSHLSNSYSRYKYVTVK